MTTLTQDQLEDFGRRLLAAGMPYRSRMQTMRLGDESDGMETAYWTVSRDHRGWWKIGPHGAGEPKDNPGYFPNLSDDATEGAVMGWLRATYDPHLSVRYYGSRSDGGWVDKWAVVSTSRSVSIQVAGYAPTRAEAIVKAAVAYAEGAR